MTLLSPTRNKIIMKIYSPPTYAQCEKIFELLEKGLTVSAIGEEVGINPYTVSRYISMILSQKKHYGVYGHIYTYRDNLRIFLANNREEVYPDTISRKPITSANRHKILNELERLNKFLESNEQA